MNKEIKELWINDLLSGEFKQGKSRLERDGEFCCLGVLCYRAAEAGIVERKPDALGCMAYNGNNANLTNAVMQWAGIDEACAQYTKPDGDLGWLTVDNDAGADFSMIAETIREYF